MSNNLAIISGNAHPTLTKELTKLKLTEIKSVVTTYPDGETSAEIQDNVRGRDIFVIQPTCMPANEHLMELLILTDTLRRASAQRITAVIPFYGYARQDRKDGPRVPITAKLVANLLTTAGVNRVVTLDLHAAQIQGFFDIPVDHLYAAPIFIRDIQSQHIDNICIMAPDGGGLKRAASYAKYLKCGIAFVAKIRTGPETVEASHMVGDVAGKNVIIVDDLTSTAGTILQAANMALEKGARSVRAYITHGVLTSKGYERLKANPVLTELVTTDSTPVVSNPELRIRVLPTAPLLAAAIHSIHNNTSVSQLFEV